MMIQEALPPLGIQSNTNNFRPRQVFTQRRAWSFLTRYKRTTQFSLPAKFVLACYATKGFCKINLYVPPC